jgi:hypothetical protein
MPDTTLFRVATKLFSSLFPNGTAQDQAASKTLIDISRLSPWHGACAQLRNCAHLIDIMLSVLHWEET